MSISWNGTIAQKQMQLCPWRPAVQHPAAIPSCQRRATISRIKVHTCSSGVPADDDSKRLLIWGLGYTATGLASQALEHGWHVTSTAQRPPAKGSHWHHVLHYDPAGGTELSQEGMELLQQATHVLTSIPPLAARLYDPVLRSQLRLMQPLKRAVSTTGGPPFLRWVGVLSSTSVYGDWHGEWVDESTPPRPSSAKGMLRLEHERAWLGLHADHGMPVHVFRLGGIYGPRRSVLDAIAKERRGQQKYTSRCHVADICAALLASMAAPVPGSVYNVVDDDPASRADVIRYAQQLVGSGIAGPTHESSSANSSPEEQPAASVQGVSTQASSINGRGRADARLEEKRVRNDKLKRELVPRLLFPTYKEGLADIFAGSTHPFGVGDLELLGYR